MTTSDRYRDMYTLATPRVTAQPAREEVAQGLAVEGDGGPIPRDRQGHGHGDEGRAGGDRRAQDRQGDLGQADLADHLGGAGDEGAQQRQGDEDVHPRAGLLLPHAEQRDAAHHQRGPRAHRGRELLPPARRWPSATRTAAWSPGAARSPRPRPSPRSGRPGSGCRLAGPVPPARRSAAPDAGSLPAEAPRTRNPRRTVR